MDRQTFAPGHRQLDKPFGGLSIILIGDFAQLPPVGDSPLYSNSPKSSLQIHGHTMYQLFTTVVILSESLQQAGSVPDAVAFRSLLLGLRNGTVNESDWGFYLIGLHRTLQTTVILPIPSGCITTKQMWPSTTLKNRSLRTPIAIISAIHLVITTSSPDDAGGLHPVLLLATHARVMLTANI